MSDPNGGAPPPTGSGRTGGDAEPALAITPDAKLGALLDRWPSLEEVLVEISPHFQALRNPVLRRTIAKVATLRQVSQVSGVALGVLIERLRAAVGAPAECPGAAAGAGPEVGAGPPPSWADPARVTQRHDARAEIEAGEHPMPAVMRSLSALAAGEIYELTTPFVPAPLLDLARGKGFDAYSFTQPDGVVRTLFRRAE